MCASGECSKLEADGVVLDSSAWLSRAHACTTTGRIAVADTCIASAIDRATSSEVQTQSSHDALPRRYLYALQRRPILQFRCSTYIGMTGRKGRTSLNVNMTMVLEDRSQNLRPKT